MSNPAEPISFHPVFAWFRRSGSALPAFDSALAGAADAVDRAAFLHCSPVRPLAAQPSRPGSAPLPPSLAAALPALVRHWQFRRVPPPRLHAGSLPLKPALLVR